jgi:hypothetical protein
VSFLLYGSAARAGDVAAADLNTLLICDRADEALFDALEPVVTRWLAAGQPAPLVVSRAEWRESADAFAIEYGDMRAAHRVLAGGDPWPGIAIDRADVRRQLEHELRGKVLRLRQGYVAARGDGRALANLVRATAGGWLTMLRTLLHLEGRPIPDRPDALVRAAAAVAGFDPEPAASLVGAARGGAALDLAPRDPRAAAYLAAVARTAEHVNVRGPASSGKEAIS